MRPLAASTPHHPLPCAFDPIVYVQNWENARHLRTVRVLSANAFAVVIAACLTALQLLRADRFSVGLLPQHSGQPWWLHLRWLYTAFYVATLLALLLTFSHRLWS